MARNFITIELLQRYISKILTAQSADGYWFVVSTRNKNAKKIYVQMLKISPHHVKLYSRFNLLYLFLTASFTLNNNYHILKKESLSEAYGWEKHKKIQNINAAMLFFAGNLKHTRCHPLKPALIITGSWRQNHKWLWKWRKNSPKSPAGRCRIEWPSKKNF